MKMNKRLIYGILTAILITAEVLIALFIHDSFVRPYVGDMLVVVVVYCLVRIFIPEGVRLLLLYVFIFAAVVEVLQYFHIVDVIGLGDSAFFRTLIGGTFDIKDIVCYGLGCIMLGLCEWIKIRQASSKDKK